MIGTTDPLAPLRVVERCIVFPFLKKKIMVLPSSLWLFQYAKQIQTACMKGEMEERSFLIQGHNYSTGSRKGNRQPISTTPAAIIEALSLMEGAFVFLKF